MCHCYSWDYRGIAVFLTLLHPSTSTSSALGLCFTLLYVSENLSILCFEALVLSSEFLTGLATCSEESFGFHFLGYFSGWY